MGLSQQQRRLLELVRSWAATELAPRAQPDERAGVFPRDLFDTLGEMGLAGLPFAAEHGGSAQPEDVYLRVVEELARAHCALGLGVSVHTLATWVVATQARPDLRRQVLAKLTGGQWLGAYCLSEPASGSDAAALVTRAQRHGDHFLVSGTKAWVTHGGEADAYVLLCRTGEHRTEGISALLVPATTSGLSFGPAERKMGLAASPTCQLHLDRARVPAGYLLGGEGRGLGIALSALDGGRVGVAACSTGLAQAALDHALAYAAQRRQFGRPIADFQGVAFMLADMATGVEAARALYLEAAQRRSAGLAHTGMAAMAKLFASDTAMRVTTDAVQILGAYGCTTDAPVERLWREAKAMQIVEGTNQIQRLVIARQLRARR